MKDTSGSIESNEDSNVLTRHCMIDRKHSKHLGKEREATGATHFYHLDRSKSVGSVGHPKFRSQRPIYWTAG